MEAITVHPKNEEQANLFEQLAKALKVPFEKRKEAKSTYNADFVAKIERSRKNYKEGKGTLMTLKELKELCK